MPIFEGVFKQVERRVQAIDTVDLCKKLTMPENEDWSKYCLYLYVDTGNSNSFWWNVDLNIEEAVFFKEGVKRGLFGNGDADVVKFDIRAKDDPRGAPTHKAFGTTKEIEVVGTTTEIEVAAHTGEFFLFNEAVKLGLFGNDDTNFIKFDTQASGDPRGSPSCEAFGTRDGIEVVSI